MIGAPKFKLRGRPKGSVVWYGSGVITPPGPPTDLTWDGDHSVLETASIGTFVGGIVTAIGGVGTVTLSMFNSAGGRFGISGNRVIVTGALDYSVATSHSITIRATDSSLNVYNEAFTVNVTNVVVPVTDIAWAGSHTVPEDAAVGTIVGGLLSHTGGEGTVTYSLFDSAGGKFSYDGTNIKVAAALNYETATSHNITIRATDTVTGTYDEVFVITVSDVSEGVPITDLNWSGTHSVQENAAVGTVVGGVLSTVGGVAPFTYSLLDDAGGKFSVDGTQIKVAGSIDFEAAEVLSITIQVTDSNLATYDDNFAINVIDIGVAYKAQGDYLTYASHGESHTLDVPTGVVAGDFLLAFLAHGRGDVPTPAGIPAGWTAIPAGSTYVSLSGFYVRLEVWYRVATGSEASSYTFTTTTEVSNSCGVMIAYTGVDTSDPFDLASTLTTGDSNAVVATGVTTLVPNQFVVFAEHDWGTTTTDHGPPSQTPNERLDDVIMYVSDGTIASTGATGTFNHTCNNDALQPWTAFVIPLKSV